jgi:hypothetical protein
MPVCAPLGEKSLQGPLFVPIWLPVQLTVLAVTVTPVAPSLKTPTLLASVTVALTFVPVADIAMYTPTSHPAALTVPLTVVNGATTTTAAVNAAANFMSKGTTGKQTALAAWTRE